MNLLIPTRPTRPPTVWSRSAWALGAIFLIAFAVFEMFAHPGWTLALGIVGALAPDVPLALGMARAGASGRLSRVAVPWYNLTHLWVLPALLLVWFSVNSQTNDQAAPGFTLALMWLAHICADRAFGFGLRNRDGWQRYRDHDGYRDGEGSRDFRE